MNNDQASVAHYHTTPKAPPPAANPVAWKFYQTDATRRMVQRCRYQRGIVLFHSMGSGKTLTSLYVMENYALDLKFLIIMPKGLDTEWRRGMADFMGGSSDPLAVEKILARTDFLSYKDIALILHSPVCFQTLAPLFRNRVVVCDEAHRLLQLVRNQPVQSEEDEDVGNCRPMDRLFHLAKRLILVTGTPMQRSLGDLSLLLNLVADETVAPPLESMFLNSYAKAASFPQFLMAQAGFIANAVLPSLTLTQKVAGGILGLMTSYTTISNYWNEVAADPTNPVGPLADFDDLFKTYAVAFAVATSFFESVSYLNRNYNKIQLDTEKILQDLGPYISYFNVATNKSPELDQKAVPLRQVVYKELPFDDFQMLQFAKMALDAGTSNLNELRVVSRISEKDVVGGSLRNADMRDDLIRLGRVIGNLCQENLLFTTVRIRLIYSKNGTKPRPALPMECNYMATIRPDLTVPLPPGVPEHVFGCEKYKQALLELFALRQKHHYLPVVYSCYDKYGLQTFSAFLTSINAPHLIVHPEDSFAHRNEIMLLAGQKHDRWPDNTLDRSKKSPRVRNAVTPLCVLIHPTLTEGLDFKLNPAIVVLEQPYGYGVQEQIYARVLRTFRPDDPVIRPLLNKDGRLEKTIIQFSNDNSLATVRLGETRFGKNRGLANISLTSPVGLRGKMPTFVDLTVKTREIALDKTHFRPVLSGLENGGYVPSDDPVIMTADTEWKTVVNGYWPVWSSFLEIISFSTVMYGLSAAVSETKSNKDRFTQYKELFKHSIYETPDQLARAVNINQEFQMRDLATKLESQSDDTVAPAPLVPVRFDLPMDQKILLRNAPADTPEVPESTRSCHLFNAQFPNDPLACNRREMDVNGPVPSVGAGVGAGAGLVAGAGPGVGAGAGAGNRSRTRVFASPTPPDED